MLYSLLLIKFKVGFHFEVWSPLACYFDHSVNDFDLHSRSL